MLHRSPKALSLAALFGLALAGCSDIPTTLAGIAPAGGPTRNSVASTNEEIVPWRSGDYRYHIGAFGHLPGFESPAFADSLWSAGRGGFGSRTGCPDASWVNTTWPTGTEILLRKSVSLPAGTTGLRIEVMIDNDVQVFVNGRDVSGGLRSHEGCANNNYLVFTVADSLLHGGDNVIAMRARDRGVVSFVDMRVTADIPSLPIDLTPPEVTPHVAGTLGDNGWYVSDVDVTWTVEDNESPITSTVGCDSVQITSDVLAAPFYCSATSAGGTASGHVTVRRDATAPVIAFAGNQGTYALTQTVAITCSATDATAGIASATCPGASGPAYSFGAGSHQLNAIAVDSAGNVAVDSVTFTVAVTSGGLCELTRQFVSQHGIANSLCAKLEAAASAQARGQTHVQQGILNAYVNEVNAQRGKAISSANADILIALVRLL